MKIIMSNSSRGAYRGVLKYLKANIGDSNIVIAPDRFTASVERGLISSLNIESTFGIEVMSFTRLADRLVGKDIKKCLTPEGSVMLIGKVIAENRDKLQYYGKVALADGFASELYAALTAIRNSGITTEMLRANIDSMSPSLKAKTSDIALIYDGYLEALSGRHSDSSTRRGGYAFLLYGYIRVFRARACHNIWACKECDVFDDRRDERLRQSQSPHISRQSYCKAQSRLPRQSTDRA